MQWTKTRRNTTVDINKIYCEDCMETMSRMEDKFIDLTVTSPPYDNLRTYNDNIDETWNEDVWKPIIKELYRVTKEGGVVVWVVGDATINGSETGTSFKQALWAMECGFNLHDTMIYSRVSPFPSNNRYHACFEYMFVLSKESPKTFNCLMTKRGQSGVSSSLRQQNGDLKEISDIERKRMIDAIDSGKTSRKNIWHYSVGGIHTSKDKVTFNHPATFPEDVAKDHIKSWSNEGDLVYDPFMGSGTTAKMAHLLKRNWIGSELSQEYVDLANKRLDPYLRQTQLF